MEPTVVPLSRSPHRWWRGISTTAVAMVVVLGTGAAIAAAVPAAPGDEQRPEAIRWESCPSPGTQIAPGQLCAAVTVPLDYRAPQRRSIEVMISRVTAGNPEQRKGALIINGGGPGPNLNILSQALQIPAVQELAKSYDLIGFDPRGVGRSTPMNCGRDYEELVRDVELELLPFPAPDGSIDRNIAYAHRMAQQCADHSGDLLPYLTTANVARDLDQVRQALGERTVSYYGVSWGTYLGAVYRTLFPRTVDRMVLDSAMDPTKIGYDQNRAFSVGLEDRWPDVARAVLNDPQLEQFGSTEQQVRENYLALTAQLDQRPVPLPGTDVVVTGNLIRTLTRQLSYRDDYLQYYLPPFWHAAANLAAGVITDAERQAIDTVLLEFVGRPGPSEIPADSALSIPWAISCGDQEWPRNLHTYAHNTATDRARYPLTAGAPANIAPCAAWTTRPVEPAVRVAGTGIRNVLILQNRRDPATPLSSAQGMRRALAADAAMVDIEAGGHGVITHPAPSTCAMTILTTFLTAGMLPTRDTSCS